jgi:hypothetical protein
MIKVTGNTTNVLYDPKDHLWLVEDIGSVWSTKECMYVNVSSNKAVQLLEKGVKITKIGTEDSLQLYLMQAGHPNLGPKYIPVESLTKSLKQVLRSDNILAQVDAVLASAGNESLHYAWDHAPKVRRDGNIAALIKNTLSLDEAGINSLFRRAVLLN